MNLGPRAFWVEQGRTGAIGFNAVAPNETNDRVALAGDFICSACASHGAQTTMAPCGAIVSTGADRISAGGGCTFPAAPGCAGAMARGCHAGPGHRYSERLADALGRRLGRGAPDRRSGVVRGRGHRRSARARSAAPVEQRGRRSDEARGHGLGLALRGGAGHCPSAVAGADHRYPDAVPGCLGAGHDCPGSAGDRPASGEPPTRDARRADVDPRRSAPVCRACEWGCA